MHSFHPKNASLGCLPLEHVYYIYAQVRSFLKVSFVKGCNDFINPFIGVVFSDILNVLFLLQMSHKALILGFANHAVSVMCLRLRHLWIRLKD